MNDLRINDFLSLDPVESTFRNLLRPWRIEVEERTPLIRIDVSEANGNYAVNAEIPGVNKEDIDVQIDGNQVTISAEVKKEKEEKEGGRILRSERQYGFASRCFTLNSPVDDTKAEAKYQNGVLHLTLPKRAQAQQKHLQIK